MTFVHEWFSSLTLALMPLTASEVQRVSDLVSAYLKGNRVIALLLFGSRANATHTETSDYDLLALTEFPAASVSLLDGKLELDTIFATLHQCQTRLQQRSPDNNNFYLNILAEAVVLFDASGLLTSLQAQAKLVYAQGPEPIAASEGIASARSLRKMLRVIQARVPKVEANPEGVLLVRMRLDELVSKAVYALFRSERRWTQSLFRTVTVLLPEFPDIHSHWLALVASPRDITQYARAAASLIEGVCSHLENKFGQ